MKYTLKAEPLLQKYRIG